MKKQILTLIIGMLIGSIITTGVFLVLKNNERSNMPGFNESNFRERIKGSMPSTSDSNEENQESQNN